MAEFDESKLLTVAEAISEGARIDWEHLDEEIGDTSGREIRRQLRVLDRIAAFHRSTEPSALPTDRPDALAGEERTSEETALRRWGHLTILEKIGEGTFGAVYRAKDDKLEREVALKLLWRSGPGSGVSTGRALKEGRLLARLRHPNVATVYGADQLDGRVGLWMEFVKGRTLAQLLREHGPFSAREAGMIGVDVCRALAAVHTAGVLHGDIKAHNIMREEGGRTVLMDFGTGKDLSKEPPRGRVDDFAGTPLYLAPEVFTGHQRTKATDIYSLGVLLYHLVTDAYPVEGRTREEVESAHQRRQRRHLRDVRPDLPDEFVQVVERALAVDPQERYQSAGAFEAALTRCLGPAPESERSWPRAHRAWITAAAAVAAVVVAAAAYWMAGRNPHGSPGTASSSSSGRAEVPAPPPESGSYRIDTALYRQLDDRQEVRLRSGARIKPGDRLFVEVRTSVPAYLYIVNEDERGGSYLLFPLPGQSVANPLPAGQTVRLPGVRGNQEVYFQVDQAGGREHFLIFASPERLATFEQMFATLPHPEVGRPVQTAAPLSRNAVGMLRSVGGLAAPPASSETSAGTLSAQFPAPLGDGEETARGLWVRQLTLDNPSQ